MSEELRTAGPVAVRVTAHGPMTGVDPVESTRVVRGELGHPHLPHLVELPERGVGADAVGRAVAILADLTAEVRPYGWRLTHRPGHEARRAVSLLKTDINVLGDVIGTEEAPGDELKIRVRGPLSLAKDLYLPSGERALQDHGARRDLADSLSVGLAEHIAAIRRAGPQRVTVHLDEPGLTEVLEGTVPTASGYRTLRSVPRHELIQTLRGVSEGARAAGAAAVVLGTDAEARSFGAIAEAIEASGIDSLAVPARRLDVHAWETLAGLVESGTGLWLGLLDVAAPYDELPGVTACVEQVRRPWRGLGLTDAQLSSVTLMPAEGFDGVAPEAVRAVLSRLHQTADALSQVAVDS
ncbi:hypothetical protein [Zhihengliuella halotolerans]|uniref:Cobalamin-independent methionine synthase catalytic subunit n=1 Tax=Zhihengliuella halotolerans TaxID=370736 RepID=A0A4Q8AAQ6_9MICC|nr:hypothetical protein [Zhihengliuella halotolerans]RZU61074.1 hypothetical protein EV380_0631 [Zhihengliuella halotolerans]